jgi:phage head maturation protease
MSPLKLLIRENPSALETREAIPRPRSFDPEALTIEAVIASTTPVRRRDQRGEFLEVLDPQGLDLAVTRGASVLDSHQQGGLDNVLGSIADVWIEGSEVVARIRFSSRPEVASVVNDVRNGIIQFLSVGYEVSQWADSQNASGQRVRTAAKWAVREASFVSVPADPRSRTRSHESGRAATNRQIRELARRAGVATHIADDLIDNESSIEAARAMIFDDLLTRGRLPIRTAHNETTTDNPEAFQRAAGEALYSRVAPGHTPSGIARQYVGMTIPDIARETLRRAGVNITALGAPALIERALHTTSDFAAILGDTVNRTLRDSYSAAPSGIRQLGRQTTAADFRAKSRLMLDSSGLTLEKVNEHGEFKSGTMSEAKESYAVDSYGRIFGITRKALVNDDVGAFTDLTRRLGQASAAFETQFLVDLLVANAGLGPIMDDANPLFDAAHGNVSGAGAAPSETTLTAARLAMRKQTGPSGGLISVTPRFLLAPPDMETACEKLLTAIQAVTVDDVNPFARLTLVIEPRFTDAKRWYVVAAPSEIDGLEYAYLAGAPGPQTETRAGFEVDGVEVKVRLDFGGGFVDWRGWYSNAGQ